MNIFVVESIKSKMIDKFDLIYWKKIKFHSHKSIHISIVIVIIIFGIFTFIFNLRHHAPYILTLFLTFAKFYTTYYNFSAGTGHCFAFRWGKIQILLECRFDVSRKLISILNPHCVYIYMGKK